MLKLTMNPRKRTKRLRSFLIESPRRSSQGQTETDNEATSIRPKDLLAENLKVLMHQEESGNYDAVDYLSMTAWQHDVHELMSTKRQSFEPSPRKPFGTDARIDEYCREQIVEWSFRVVDYFRIDREVVSVSMSFLDRFLATCNCDRSTFKLAATTTLYLAVKLLHPYKLGDLGILSDLSRGEFDMMDVAEMESHILQTLSWYLTPPTAPAIAAVLLDYIFCDNHLQLPSADLDDIYDIAAFFTELAVCDYFFVSRRASTIALAAILDALEGVLGPNNVFRSHVLNAAHALGMTTTHQEMVTSRNRLWELYERSEECALHSDKSHDDVSNATPANNGIFVKKASTLLSPVSVTKPCKSSSDLICASFRVNSIHNGSW